MNIIKDSFKIEMDRLVRNVFGKASSSSSSKPSMQTTSILNSEEISFQNIENNIQNRYIVLLIVLFQINVTLIPFYAKIHR